MKMAEKYYLIEKYEDNISQRMQTYTYYDVRAFDSVDKLVKAYLQGPQRGGTLIPAKEVELEIRVKDEYDANIRPSEERRTDKKTGRKRFHGFFKPRSRSDDGRPYGGPYPSRATRESASLHPYAPRK